MIPRPAERGDLLGEYRGPDGRGNALGGVGGVIAGFAFFFVVILLGTVHVLLGLLVAIGLGGAWYWLHCWTSQSGVFAYERGVLVRNFWSAGDWTPWENVVGFRSSLKVFAIDRSDGSTVESLWLGGTWGDAAAAEMEAIRGAKT